jgi:hypothetical protein
MKSVRLTIDNQEYKREVRDLRRLLDAANDAETPWIQEWYQSAVHDSTRAVGWNFRKELAEAICAVESCEEELGKAVEGDVLKLGFESE